MSLSPLSGFKNSTTFSFQQNLPSWDFVNWGDGSFSNQNGSFHIYSSIGLYNVFASNVSSTSSFSVSVYNGDFYSDKIQANSVAASSFASCPASFFINLSSSQQINTISLYASGSKSLPFNENRNFWSHLNPEWCFSFAGKPTTKITMTGNPVYSGSTVLGYSCCSCVQFKDDLPSNLNLFFTMEKKESDVPMNSRVYSCLSFSVVSSIPDKLFITSDGINPLNPIQWIGKDLPVVISVGSSQNSCTNILHYASGAIVDVRMNSTCSNVKSENMQCSFGIINGYDDFCFPAAGYYKTSVKYNLDESLKNIISNNLKECNSNKESLTFLKTTDFLKNVCITASASLYHEKLEKENILIFVEQNASPFTLSGQYLDLQAFDGNQEKEIVRFWFAVNGFPFAQEPPNPGRLNRIDLNQRGPSDPPETDRTNTTNSIINALASDSYFNGANFSITDQYTINLTWPSFGAIQESNSSTSLISLSSLTRGSLINQTSFLTGQSDFFSLVPFENRHEFYRKGEDFGVYDVLKESLPFDLMNFSNFNCYLSSIAGKENLGAAYDKISNFSSDHSDLETCTFEVLNDKALLLNDRINDFGLELPCELKRLFNFSTIPLQKLIGTRCNCNQQKEFFVNESNVCSVCGSVKKSNLGKRITPNDFVSAGQTVLVKNQDENSFHFYTVKPQNTDVFQLKELSSTVINGVSNKDVCFFEFLENSFAHATQNIINYQDERNKLNLSLTANGDWYGDCGIIEEMFSYILHKNLI